MPLIIISIAPITTELLGISLKNKNPNNDPQIKTEYLKGAVSVRSAILNE